MADFWKWLKSADTEIQGAVNQNFDRGLNERKIKLIELYGIYLQDQIYTQNIKLAKYTKILAIATWILAIATILLVFVTRG